MQLFDKLYLFYIVDNSLSTKIKSKTKVSTVGWTECWEWNFHYFENFKNWVKEYSHALRDGITKKFDRPDKNNNEILLLLE